MHTTPSTAITRVIGFVIDLFSVVPQHGDNEAYLAGSTDITDLERRMRTLERTTSGGAGFAAGFLPHTSH